MGQHAEYLWIYVQTSLLENGALLTFKWCFNLSFEKQLSSSTLLVSGSCCSRSFCLGKEQAQVAALHGMLSYMLDVTLVQCIFEVFHQRILRDCLTELNLNCMQTSQNSIWDQYLQVTENYNDLISQETMMTNSI